MFLSISAHGETLKNSFDYQDDYYNDFTKFQYYRDVFDNSNDFKQTYFKEIDGGTYKGGVTSIGYTSTKGCSLILEIDGGIPLPELADMVLLTDTLTQEAFYDIVKAFESYHNTKFTYFKTSVEGNLDVGSRAFLSIRLFDKKPAG